MIRGFPRCGKGTFNKSIRECLARSGYCDLGIIHGMTASDERSCQIDIRESMGLGENRRVSLQTAHDLLVAQGRRGVVVIEDLGMFAKRSPAFCQRFMSEIRQLSQLVVLLDANYGSAEAELQKMCGDVPVIWCSNLTRDETAAYVPATCRRAELLSDMSWDHKAFNTIYEMTGGYPLQINFVLVALASLPPASQKNVPAATLVQQAVKNMLMSNDGDYRWLELVYGSFRAGSFDQQRLLQQVSRGNDISTESDWREKFDPFIKMGWLDEIDGRVSIRGILTQLIIRFTSVWDPDVADREQAYLADLQNIRLSLRDIWSRM